MMTIPQWMSETLATLRESFDPISDTLDIAIVAVTVYWGLVILQGTRARQLMLGLLLVVFAYVMSQQLELPMVSFLLENFLSWGVLIVIVIFQRDIRRALTKVGLRVFRTDSSEELQAIEEIVRACQALSQRRTGALLVLQRELELDEHMELGTTLDATLSRNLLMSIFMPPSPLHDGAVIVREGRIAAAGCILPLALGDHLPSSLGTRHRAALGLSEETDATILVVSEETSTISIAANGRLYRPLTADQVRDVLTGAVGRLETLGVPASAED